MKGLGAILLLLIGFLLACERKQENDVSDKHTNLWEAAPYRFPGEAIDSIVACKGFDHWSFSPMGRIGKWDSVTLPRTDLVYHQGRITRETIRHGTKWTVTTIYRNEGDLTFSLDRSRDDLDSTIWVNFIFPQQHISLAYTRCINSKLAYALEMAMDSVSGITPTPARLARMDSLPEIYSLHLLTPTSTKRYVLPRSDEVFTPWKMPKSVRQLMDIQLLFKEEHLTEWSEIITTNGGEMAVRTITYYLEGQPPDTTFEEIPKAGHF